MWSEAILIYVHQEDTQLKWQWNSLESVLRFGLILKTPLHVGNMHHATQHPLPRMLRMEVSSVVSHPHTSFPGN
jgi:hypothetical protein